MAIGIPVNLTLPADGDLGPKLLGECQRRQKIENKAATAENREARAITIQETILALCAESLGVTIEPPRRGRRWPKKAE